VIAFWILALPLALSARETAPEISFQPLSPTSRDEVAVRVAGTASTPCLDPALFPSVTGRTIRLDLDLGRCASQPVSAPGARGARGTQATRFAASAAVGPLPAGRYAVQVYSDGALQATEILEVASAPSEAGMMPLSGLGTLAVIVLLALAGSVLLR